MREMTAAALAATAPKRRAARKSWRPLLLAASVAAVAVIGCIGLLPLFAPEPPSPAVAYATDLGAQRTERLPDGTRIILTTQPAVEVRYSRQIRQHTPPTCAALRGISQARTPPLFFPPNTYRAT